MIEPRRKKKTTYETHVYSEVCSWDNPRKAFEPKKNISARERKRKYEEQHHERKFNRDWQAKRPWLKFDDKKTA